MNIEKMKSGAYRIREMYQGKMYRVTVPYKPTRHEARELIMAKIEGSDDIPKEARTFLDACKLYIDLKSNVLSPSTITGYHAIIRGLSDDFKALRLSDLTALDVQKEVNDFSASHSPKSVRNLHGFISAVLSIYRPKLVLKYHASAKVPL